MTRKQTKKRRHSRLNKSMKGGDICGWVTSASNTISGWFNGAKSHLYGTSQQPPPPPQPQEQPELYNALNNPAPLYKPDEWDSDGGKKKRKRKRTIKRNKYGCKSRKQYKYK